jgi:hypothetical protein
VKLVGFLARRQQHPTGAGFPLADQPSEILGHVKLVVGLGYFWLSSQLDRVRQLAFSLRVQSYELASVEFSDFLLRWRRNVAMTSCANEENNKL